MIELQDILILSLTSTKRSKTVRYVNSLTSLHADPLYGLDITTIDTSKKCADQIASKPLPAIFDLQVETKQSVSRKGFDVKIVKVSHTRHFDISSPDFPDK
jgi:hypothetical protein